MLQHIKLVKLLFLDIETASEEASFLKLEEPKQIFWGKKHYYIQSEELDTPLHSYNERAAIYAEFGKVICISCGYFKGDKLYIRSFYKTSEAELLQSFSTFLERQNLVLCGHNIKEFDVPFLCRRMLVNHISLPKVLNIAGKKPWEVNFVDTLQLWKFGDYKSYTSLDLLAHIFKIPSSKDDINGSQVAEVYWQEKDLSRIVKYCQKDVVTVVRLVQRWQQVEPIPDKLIIIKNGI